MNQKRNPLRLVLDRFQPEHAGEPSLLLRRISGLAVIAGWIVTAGCGTPPGTNTNAPAGKSSGSRWETKFDLANRILVSTGRSTYCILEPGFQLVLSNKVERLAVTVLDQTVEVGGITTRVVEEREWKNGELIEVSRNFFAIDKDTLDVFYFGEEVDDYSNGKISGHGGAWRADAANCQAGLIMPGSPRVGLRYYQEIAPGVAMDRAEVVSLDETLDTPAGSFVRCLKTREGSALKPLEKEYKLYAPGVGLIKEGDMLLVSYGFPGK